MQVLAERKAAAFLARVGAHLNQSPIENNLLIGIASSLEPAGGAEPLLLRVESEEDIELVAVQTLPRPIVLSRGNGMATHRLAEHLAAVRASIAGVLGPRE